MDSNRDVVPRELSCVSLQVEVTLPSTMAILTVRLQKCVRRNQVCSRKRKPMEDWREIPMGT
jgi:hypothetical protein